MNDVWEIAEEKRIPFPRNRRQFRAGLFWGRGFHLRALVTVRGRSRCGESMFGKWRGSSS